MTDAPNPKRRRTIEEQIRESIAVKQRLLDDAKSVAIVGDIVTRCVTSLRAGGKVLTAGNGGSAADAQHIAGELVARFYFDRPSLAATALTTDSSALTAIGNDYGYEQIFARQIEGLGRSGDIFLAISTSGNSPNILAALRVARARGLVCVGLTGSTGGQMKALCDLCLCVPSDDTPRIQEAHELVAHVVCAQIESLLFAQDST